MKIGSGICKSKVCEIGQQDPLLAINEAAAAIEREIDTGEFTLNSIPSLTQNFRETAVARIETPIQRQIRLYGEEGFYTAVASINAYFEKPEIREILQRESGILPRYLRVRERVEISPLSPIEVTAFMDQYQYVPRTLTRQSNILSEKLISELENFYTDNISESISGGFCALMPNIFAAIDTFFTALSDIRNFINQVRDFAANFQENLQNLINQIRDQVLETVTRVVEDIRNVIENFTLENVFNEVRTFVESRIMSQFYALRERALSFFSEFNIENIRNRIIGIIDYISRVFQNPTLEDIQYLIYRLCNLASLIENSFNDLLNPLRDFRNNLQNSFDVIRGRSFFNTAGAIAAGGIRLTEEERERRRREAPTSPSPSVPPSPAAPSPATPSTPPSPPSNVRPATEEEEAQLPRWTPGGGTDTSIFNMSGLEAAYQWDNMERLVRIMLMRVQRRFGRPFLLVSGWRSYETQLGLYRSIGRRAGLSDADIERAIRTRRNPIGNRVALPGNSQHESGLAFDLRWDGINRESIIRVWGIAVEEGFTGFGDYAGNNNFVHIDRRNSTPYSYRYDRLNINDLRALGISTG